MAVRATEIVWQPTREHIEQSRLVAFMRQHGIPDYAALHRRSVEDLTWFWDAVAKDLRLEWFQPYSRVLDTSRGIQWATWWIDGKFNYVHNCLDRHIARLGDKVACIAEREDGTIRHLTYREMLAETNRLANALRRLGIKKGDRVGIFMPMTAECAIATLAVNRIGAIYVPIFSGFAPNAVATRLQDAEAVALITADGGGRALDRRAGSRLGRAHGAGVRRLSRRGHGRGRPAHAHLHLRDDGAAEGHRPRARGIPHQGHNRPGLDDGAVGDHRRPDAGRYDGPLRRRHRLPRTRPALEPGGPAQSHHARDLPDCGARPDALRRLGSTGEPWNPEPWMWLFEQVGRRRCPIMNYTGGTEIAGGILGCTVLHPQKPMVFTGPVLGMDADVYDENGQPVRGAVGELVVRQPWPGMTRGFWRDPERYLETYWSRWPNVWVHGDWAKVDEDGFWYILGRSDDTIKVAGKRVGPAEVESAVVAHPAVAEAAAIGVPDAVKGEAVVCFAVLRHWVERSEDLRAAIKRQVVEMLGKALEPKEVKFVNDLPKTRNAKIMRRVIRAAHLGTEPGDLSSLENPQAVEDIRRAG